MANTYTQLYIHYVFATEQRLRLLTDERQTEIYAYSAGLVKELQCFFQCIGGTDDHIHLLIGLHPTVSVTDFARKYKANISRFINAKGWAKGKFAWQEGYGAFSVSQSGLQQVRDYISKQREHHHNTAFKAEYEALLSAYQIDFDRNYAFHSATEE